VSATTAHAPHAHAAHGAHAPHGAADERSWALLILLAVAQFMVVLDVTVVNVALPTIQDDLDFTQSSLAWVVNAYLIAFGGLLLLAGRFGERPSFGIRELRGRTRLEPASVSGATRASSPRVMIR